ncbi:MAG: hypothetical protein J7K48_04650 [Thermococcus sp.]|nr:hypothetical protein [Thermococcus sp.]
MRDFRRWCAPRGLDPEEFYVPGAGYVVPQEFVTWWFDIIFPQYVRHGKVERASLARTIIARRAKNVPVAT